MLHVVDHPLIKSKLSIMRDKNVKCFQFKQLLDEISSLMTYEVFKDVKTKKGASIETPTKCKINKIELQKDIVIVPILRAGIGMSNGVEKMLPTAKIGHIGLYRNEKTLEPVEYYCKMPKVKNPLVVVCDPMLATGGSASDAITMLKKRGFKDIRLLCLVGVKKGIDKVLKDHPETEIFIASVDKKLNEKGYILPGLGDAGDRIFGTL